MSLPPILQQLQGNNMGGMVQIRQMMQMVRNAGNPQAMMSQLMQSNPQMKQVMDAVNQYGGDPKKAFYSLCEQRGVDPNQILNMIK